MFRAVLHHFVLAKLATSNIRIKVCQVPRHLSLVMRSSICPLGDGLSEGWLQKLDIENR